MSEALSPESGSFPKRRPAALSRLNVPAEVPEAQSVASGLPSCHSDAPPLSAGRRPRVSKPGASPEPSVVQAVITVVSLLLLLMLAAVAMYRQKQLAVAMSTAEKQHQDEMNLQVAWLAATMSEHEQCKAALTKADADYKVAQADTQACEATKKQQAEQAAATSRAATAKLQVELEAAHMTTKAATDSLTKAKAELKTAQQQQQHLQQQVGSLQQQVGSLQQQLKAEQQARKADQERWDKDKEQLHKAAAAPAATTAAHASVPTSTTAHGTTAGNASSAASELPVVMVTCGESDMAPDDIITPWCRAVTVAGVRRVMMVTDSDSCVAAAKAAGIKVLKHTFQVPASQGPLSSRNLGPYRRYAALQQVLLLGYSAVSVSPEVLLLSDPLPLLHQHPTDVTAMSMAGLGEDKAYGHLQAAPSPDNPTSFTLSALSTGLLHLRPTPASLQFVTAMMAALATGHQPEADLLNTLLLSPWHIHTATDSIDGNVHSGATSTTTTTFTVGSHSNGPVTPSDDVTLGHGATDPLPLPVTVGVLPVSLFTLSEVVFKQPDPQAWLKVHQPMALVMHTGPSRHQQVQEVLQWLEADIQEVIQVLTHLPEQGQAEAKAGPPAAAAGAAAVAAVQAAHASNAGPGQGQKHTHASPQQQQQQKRQTQQQHRQLQQKQRQQQKQQQSAQQQQQQQQHQQKDQQQHQKQQQQEGQQQHQQQQQQQQHHHHHQAAGHQPHPPPEPGAAVPSAPAPVAPQAQQGARHTPQPSHRKLSSQPGTHGPPAAPPHPGGQAPQQPAVQAAVASSSSPVLTEHEAQQVGGQQGTGGIEAQHPAPSQQQQQQQQHDKPKHRHRKQMN